MDKMTSKQAYDAEAMSGGQYYVVSITQDLSDLNVVALIIDDDGACRSVLVEN